MARIYWFPEVLRNAGLSVIEVDRVANNKIYSGNGWRNVGSSTFNPKGLIVHATAGSKTSSDVGEVGVILNGSKTAPPPISQLYLSRTGTWYVIASGQCNHALTGWGGKLKNLGNPNLIGIEAANDNRSEIWSTVQYDSYVRGVAAICRKLGWDQNKVSGHKEHQPWPPPAWTTSSKSDPTFDMNSFRASVAKQLLKKEEETEVSFTEAEKKKLLKFVEATNARIEATATGVNGYTTAWSGKDPKAVENNWLLTRIEEIVASKVNVEIDYAKLAKAIITEVSK